eukprot:gnl/Carplike_NY0171/4768_a6497_201.p1 GENE.gnl/Carplike_NY0171/4768_a6497_201~~gnl/Carplike_NY0171/4768_a6497_201.p1  ORF type:complete len:707 (-),score=317.55 gnl/Carplike_NY0171/4768_a6497_201:16-2085(-)
MGQLSEDYELKKQEMKSNQTHKTSQYRVNLERIFSAEKDDLRKTLDKDRQTWKKQLEKQKLDHIAQIHKQEEEFEKEVERQRRVWEQKREELYSHMQQQLSTAEKEKLDGIRESERRCAQSIERAAIAAAADIRALNEKIVAMRNTHSASIAEMRRKREEDFTKLQQTHTSEMAEAEGKLLSEFALKRSELEKQQTERIKKMRQELMREREQHISDLDKVVEEERLRQDQLRKEEREKWEAKVQETEKSGKELIEQERSTFSERLLEIEEQRTTFQAEQLAQSRKESQHSIDIVKQSEAKERQNLETKHKETLDKLTALHEARVIELEKSFELRAANMKEEHDKLLQGAKKAAENAHVTATIHIEKEREEIDKLYVVKMHELKSMLAKEKIEIENKFKEQQKALMSSWEREKAAFESRLTSSTALVSEMRDKMREREKELREEASTRESEISTRYESRLTASQAMIDGLHLNHKKEIEKIADNYTQSQMEFERSVLAKSSAVVAEVEKRKDGEIEAAEQAAKEAWMKCEREITKARSDKSKLENELLLKLRASVREEVDDERATLRAQGEELREKLTTEREKITADHLKTLAERQKKSDELSSSMHASYKELIEQDKVVHKAHIEKMSSSHASELEKLYTTIDTLEGELIRQKELENVSSEKKVADAVEDADHEAQKRLLTREKELSAL